MAKAIDGSMAYNRNGMAHDAEPQEISTESRRLRALPNARRRLQRRKATVSCLVLVFVVSLTILMGNMYLTQLTAETAQAAGELDRLTAESVSLKTRQAYSLDMNEVEDYAVNHLGMVKMDNGQIEYVELVNPDSITTYQSGASLNALFGGLAKSFSAALEYIR